MHAIIPMALSLIISILKTSLSIFIVLFSNTSINLQNQSLIFFLIKFSLQTLAKHVISVHVNASNNRLQESTVEGELSLELLKKFVFFEMFFFFFFQHS